MRVSTVVAALAFLAAPSIASAHAGNNDPNMVHACIGNVSRVVRIVGPTGSCIPAPPVLAETAAHWPQTQAAGVPGPKGDKGDRGLPGPQGNPGLNGTNGTNGANGTNGINGMNGANGTSVTFVGYVIAGDATCPHGGVVYSTGTPPAYAYVCNGRNGVDATAGARPDPPCFDNGNRYVNCGNGTVTDTDTGLIWLADASCLGQFDFAGANRAAGTLASGQCGLTDNSAAGDWRLPTHAEWAATVARAVAMGCRTGQAGTAPSLTNDAGTACMATGPSSFTGVTIIYWSSSSIEGDPALGWYQLLDYAFYFPNKIYAHGVWPVRGGTR